MSCPPDFIPPSPPPIQVGIYTVPTAGWQSAPARHGGRRPGAGAKPGNLNALKHGRPPPSKAPPPPPPFAPAGGPGGAPPDRGGWGTRTVPPILGAARSLLV